MPNNNETEDQRKVRLLNKKVNRLKKTIDLIMAHLNITQEKLDKIAGKNKKLRPDIKLAKEIFAKKKGKAGYKFFDALREARAQLK